jgi:nickel-dependent lactate racemase
MQQTEVVHVPYGRGTVEIRVPKKNLMGVYTPPGAPAASDPEVEVAHAIANPIGCSPLAEHLKPGMSVCIVVSDITRPVPYRYILPPLLAYLNRSGIPDKDITLLVATGLHRPNTDEEQRLLYGADIVKRVRVINHCFNNYDNLVSLGVTSFGTPIEVNRLAVDSDILITTGYIEPHQQLGFTGGRKSILPGIASERAVMHNHSAAMMDHVHAVNGLLDGNPQHEDSLEFAQKVGVDYIINVILNQDGKLYRAVAGDLKEAYLAGVAYSRAIREVVLPELCDVAITASGYPLDQVVYQGPKISSSIFRIPRPIIREGGTVIIPMEATEGIGFHREFYDLMSCCGNNPEALIAKMYAEPSKDQWGAQIWVRMLQHLRMVIVTRNMTTDQVEAMGMAHFTILQAAVDDALARYGENCRIAVFPEAPSVLLRVADEAEKETGKEAAAKSGKEPTAKSGGHPL